MRAISILLPTLLLAACAQPAPPASDASTSPPTAAATPSEHAPTAGLSPDAVATAAEPVAEAGAVPAPATEPASADGDVRQRIERLLGDAPRYEAVFTALQKGVAAHDVAAVAALPLYPVNVNVGGSKRKVADAATFAREYDRIITADIAKAIAAQTFDDVFVNGQGVMLGNGQIWINGICPANDCSKANIGIVTVQD